MPTPPDLSTNDRLRGLPERARQLAQRAQACIERGDPLQAAALLDEVLAHSAAHPELLRLRGLADHFQGRFAEAAARLREAARAWSADGLIESNLGAALAQGGDIDAALRSFKRATESDPTLIDAWFNLGRALELRAEAAGAHAAFSAVLELDPRHRAARILRAEASKTLGRIDESEAELRAVLKDDPGSVPAWVALSNLKSFRADADDLRALAALHAHGALTPAQRIDIGFAYASQLETAGNYARAFEVFAESNAAKRRTLRWDSAAIGKLVDDILAAFASPQAQTQDASRGSGIVFLVGMPRSGSTLAEQIIAAHPEASAGAETGLVAQVLQHESKRRGTRFPHWVKDASDDDWIRLGEDYLARIAALKGDARVFTDKTLTNWQTLGALRRMLPGARIVQCRRDALETAWSCYKHNFARDQLYSYDIDELAAFFRDQARAMDAWKARHPDWIHEHRYEALIAEPESSVRALLAHCGLSFDAVCLDFHAVERDVRTASAAQVRRPLDKDTAVAKRYGTLLDPLRRALGDL